MARSALLEPRKERPEARLTPEQKKYIERAAQIRGTSVSDFVVTSAADAGLRTIREQEVLTLNERAREVFVRALLSPPLPGKRLLAAAKRYKGTTKLQVLPKATPRTYFRIEPLSKMQDRETISGGIEALDSYLKRPASQDVAKHTAACFVLTPDGKTVAGFYTPSKYAVDLARRL